MCYGSGCSKEDHTGDCVCFLNTEQIKLLENSEYKSQCLLYGNKGDIADFYLLINEYLKIEWLILEGKISEIEKIERLALDRWREDQDRIDFIKRLEEK